MKDVALKMHFLETVQGVRGYGPVGAAGGCQILVAPWQDLENNPDLMRGLTDPQTRAIALTDQTDTTPIIAEIEVLASRLRLDRAFNFKFHASKDGLADFFKSLAHDVPVAHFQKDVTRAYQALAPLFRDKSFPFIRLLVRRTEESKVVTRWHEDFFDQDDRLLAVRCLSSAGTSIALGDIKRVNEGSVLYVVNDAAHAGQGLYILKGNTVHAAPVTPCPRWVYVMNGVSH
jgi:hypothetical protein